MVLGPSEYNFDLLVENSTVATTDTLRILGVTLDRKLTFKEQIFEQTKKACAKAAALKRIRKFIPLDVRSRLYKAYILPHLEYCSPLMLGITDGLINKLENTNYHILKSVLGFCGSTSYEYLLNLVGISTLKKRREYHALLMVYKSINNLGPSYLQELFKLKTVNYNLRGSGTLLEMPRFNLEFCHRSFRYLGAQLWNTLPTKIREAEDFPSFKLLLRKHVGM